MNSFGVLNGGEINEIPFLSVVDTTYNEKCVEMIKKVAPFLTKFYELYTAHRAHTQHIAHTHSTHIENDDIILNISGLWHPVTSRITKIRAIMKL